MFVRQRRGFYATADFRFVLESYRGRHTVTWKLLERGALVAIKPGKLRTATARAPLWLRTDNAQGAVAWAKHVVGGGL